MVEPITLQPAFEISAACCESTATSRLSDAQAQEAANLLKALADPARLQILDILSQHGGQVCACDFEGKVGLPAGNGQRPKQPTVSHHLKVLREAGLIDGEKQGLWIYYAVCPERLATVQDLLEMLNGQPPQATAKAIHWAQSQKACC